VTTLAIGQIRREDLLAVDAERARPIRPERPQRDDRPGAIGFDLRVGVAPRERVRLQRFPERHRRHLGIRPIVEQGIDGVIRRALFAAPEPAIREQRE
jgi:hypothetical protein